jgi:hypothetical protein
MKNPTEIADAVSVGFVLLFAVLWKFQTTTFSKKKSESFLCFFLFQKKEEKKRNQKFRST